MALCRRHSSACSQAPEQKYCVTWAASQNHPLLAIQTTHYFVAERELWVTAGIHYAVQSIHSVHSEKWLTTNGDSLDDTSQNALWNNWKKKFIPCSNFLGRFLNKMGQMFFLTIVASHFFFFFKWMNTFISTKTLLKVLWPSNTGENIDTYAHAVSFHVKLCNTNAVGVII